MAAAAAAAASAAGTAAVTAARRCAGGYRWRSLCLHKPDTAAKRASLRGAVAEWSMAHAWKVCKG